MREFFFGWRSRARCPLFLWLAAAGRRGRPLLRGAPRREIAGKGREGSAPFNAGVRPVPSPRDEILPWRSGARIGPDPARSTRTAVQKTAYQHVVNSVVNPWSISRVFSGKLGNDAPSKESREDGLTDGFGVEVRVRIGGAPGTARRALENSVGRSVLGSSGRRCRVARARHQARCQRPRRGAPSGGTLPCPSLFMAGSRRVSAKWRGFRYSLPSL